MGPKTLRVGEGERVRLQWSSDQPAEVHLHGYDIETKIEPGQPAVTAFDAETAGRFPVTAHGLGGEDHTTLLYLEVLPH